MGFGGGNGQTGEPQRVVMHDERIANEDQPTPPPLDAPEHLTNGAGQHLTRRHRRASFYAVDHVAEQALLGALLMGADPGLVDLAAWTIPGAQAVHDAVSQIHDGKPVDLRLVERIVGHELDRFLVIVDGLDYTGPAALVILASRAPTRSAAPHFAAIVADQHRLRLLSIHIANAEQALLDGQADAVLEHLDAARDVGGTSAAAIDYEDVAAVVRGEVEEVRPTILHRHDGSALMYAGLTHWLMGEPGKGKTWVALHVVAEQLNAGEDVLYLDWEGNRRIIGSRLRALGVDAATVAEHLHYLRPPVLDHTLATRLADTATHCSLAIFDGVAKAIARQGLNEDRAPDVLAWLELLVNPISEAGAAGLLLDHVTKEREGRGLWARGSGAKLGEVSGAAWLVKPKQGFSRNAGGRIDLVQAKDREGYVAADGAVVANIGFMPDPALDTLTITVRAPAEHGDSDTPFRPTGIMEKVSRTVERFAESGIEPGVNQIDNDLPGSRREWIVKAIGCLVSEGYLVAKPGPGRKVQHASIRPYRELDDPLSDRYSNAADDAKDERWNDL